MSFDEKIGHRVLGLIQKLITLCHYRFLSVDSGRLNKILAFKARRLVFSGFPRSPQGGAEFFTHEKGQKCDILLKIAAIEIFFAPPPLKSFFKNGALLVC